MINLDETIRAIYYIAGHQQDWLCGVNQSAEGMVTVIYRFRYYDPADPDNDSWSGKDKKNWYEMKGSKDLTLERALEGMQKMYDELLAHGYSAGGGAPACKLIRGPLMTHQQFAEEFTKLPFMHRKEVT